MRYFRAAGGLIKGATQSYFTFQAVQGVSAASVNCSKQSTYDCLTSLAVAMMYALPQGIDTFHAVSAQFKGRAPTEPNVIVEPKSKIETNAALVDQLIEKQIKKAEENGIDGMSKPTRSAVEWAKMINYKPSFTLKGWLASWAKNLHEVIETVKSGDSQSRMRDLGVILGYFKQRKLNRIELARMESLLTEGKFANLDPNDPKTRSSIYELNYILYRDQPAAIQILNARILIEGMPEVLLRLDSMDPNAGFFKHALGKAAEATAPKIAKVSKVFSAIRDSAIRAAQLKWPKIDFKRVMGKTPEAVLSAVDTKGYSAAVELYETEFAHAFLSANRVGVAEVEWRAWIKDSWDLGVYAYLTATVIHTWKKGYGDDLDGYQKQSEEISKEIAKNYKRSDFLNDLCQAWLATYVKETPSDDQITAALQGFVQVADEVGASSGQSDSRSLDTKIGEAREIFEKVRHEQQK